MKTTDRDFIFMNNITTTNLVPLQDTEFNGEVVKTVNARELWEYLEIKSRFNDWIKSKLEDKLLGFVYGNDYITSTRNLVNGIQANEYHVTIEVAKELCMLERKEKGAEARKYFIECEKQLKQITPSYQIQDPIERAKAWIKEQEEKRQLQLENTEQKEHINRLVHTGKTFTSTEIAKELGLRSAIELNKLLDDRKVQYKVNKSWVLYSKYADQNLTSIKEIELNSGRVIYDRRWTGLGRDFVLDLLSE